MKEATKNIGTNFKVAETGTESNEAGPVYGSFSDDTNVVNKQTNGWWFSNETSSNPPILLQYILCVLLRSNPTRICMAAVLQFFTATQTLGMVIASPRFGAEEGNTHLMYYSE